MWMELVKKEKKKKEKFTFLGSVSASLIVLFDWFQEVGCRCWMKSSSPGLDAESGGVYPMCTQHSEPLAWPRGWQPLPWTSTASQSWTGLGLFSKTKQTFHCWGLWPIWFLLGVFCIVIFLVIIADCCIPTCAQQQPVPHTARFL